MADVEKVTLTIAEREAIYGAGDHHPEQCDCTGYAVEYLDAPGSQHCPALVDTFEAVERIIAARLAKNLAEIEAIFAMQCPPMRAENYIDPGAHAAHQWWNTVLGSALRRQRDSLFPSANPTQEDR